MKLSEILPELQKHFLPEEHKERKLKGNGTWFFVSHQAIRDRLNQVCPDDWSEKYILSHREAEGDPIYLCELTICGVTRVGIGDKSNEPSPYGTPAQRAFRKAFTDACESFGIASYLDDQTNPKTKADFVRYMQRSGDGRAATYYHQNEGSLPAKKTGPSSVKAKPFGAAVSRLDQPVPPATEQPNGVISEAQRKRFWSIAKKEGEYSDDAFKELLKKEGIASSKDILVSQYDDLCRKAANKELGKAFNEQVGAVAATVAESGEEF